MSHSTVHNNSDDGIYHIGGTGTPAQIAGQACRVLVQRYWPALLERLIEPCLLRSAAPDLPDHPGRDNETIGIPARRTEPRPSSPAVVLESDQFTGVQSDTRGAEPMGVRG